MTSKRALKQPSEVKVGPFTWTIEWSKAHIDKEAVEAGQRLAGCCQAGKLRIIIDPGQPDDGLRETLLHELLHACRYVSGGSLEPVDSKDEKSDDLEEQAISLISPQLFGVLRENPDLMEFLLG